MTTLQFQNARLIDPETQSDEIGSLTIRDGRIDAVNADAPTS